MSPLPDPLFDGHTHTGWCPHGSGRPLREFLESAVAKGFRRYAVTEHVPLPDGLIDPLGPLECANAPETLGPYLDEVERLRDEYADRLEVLPGLEVDYFGAARDGWHGALLEQIAPHAGRLHPEATLLSIHLIDDRVMDGSVAEAAALIPAGGTIDDVHLRYYRLLETALTCSWRWGRRDLRPGRVAHLTLPNKWRRSLPLREPERVLDAATVVLERIASEGLSLDLNTAGYDKPDCGESYLPRPLLDRALALGIPVVLGSDAHHPAEVGRHFEAATTAARGLSPVEGTWRGDSGFSPLQGGD